MNKTLIEIINEHGDLSHVCKGQLSIPIGFANARYCTMAKSHFGFECKALTSLYGEVHNCQYSHTILNNGFKEYNIEENNFGDC